MTSQKELVPAEKMLPEIKRMALDIHRRYSALEQDYAFVGIQQMGVPLAEKLKEIIEKDQNVWCFLGALTGMIGLAYDEEVTKMAHELIDKETKLPL